MNFSASEKHNVFEERGIKRAIIVSFAAHGCLLAFLILKSIVAPSEPKEYLPSMRVDLVALPSHKINETVSLEPVAEPKAQEKPEVKTPEVKVKPVSDADVSLSKKKKTAEKLKNALAKIKALEKVSAEPIAGNKISKGSALNGEAKTSLETTYFDVVLEKVRANWELPKWLQDQSYTARVLLKIDRSGNILSLLLLKPSGNDQFDQEVKRAVQSSAPFPAPPISALADVSSDGITLGFPL